MERKPGEGAGGTSSARWGASNAAKQQPRIPGEWEETNSTVETRNPQAQNARHCFAPFRPLLSRGLALRPFLGSGVCVCLLLPWTFLP